MIDNKAYYSNRKIKYSFRNKRSDTFKLRLNYLNYIIYKKLNYYNNRYTEEKKAINKNKWFIKRKVNNYKPFNKKFRSYLIYIEGNDLISMLIRFSSKNRNDYFYSELLKNNEEFKLIIDSNDNNDFNYFTEVFIISEKKYDIWKVL